MHVYTDGLPGAPMMGLHPHEEVERSLLRLHAVHAHVPPQLDGERELRFEHRNLVRDRNRERRELPPAIARHRRVWRVCGRCIRDATYAVETYFAEHRIGKGLQRGTEGGYDE